MSTLMLAIRECRHASRAYSFSERMIRILTSLKILLVRKCSNAFN